MRVTFGMLIMSLLLGMAAFFTLSSRQSKMQKHVGERYIIDGDTLTVIDYTVFGERYTFSNGMEVDRRILQHSMRVE